MGWNIGRVVRDVRRVRQIVNVFFEFGFEHFILNSKFMSHVSLFNRVKKKDKSISEARRFVMALEKLGPTFVKLGQLLSTRPDLIPREYFNELKSLQDKVDPLPFDKLKPIIEREIGLDKFKLINEVALASASLSQVHKAVLKNGKHVILKILKPGVKETIESDLDILSYLAYEIEKHIPKLAVAKPVKIINEFKKYTKHEIDLSVEAGNAKKFDMFIGKKTKIPKIYGEYSSKDVMVMEYLTANKISDKKHMKTMLDSFFIQVFDYGYFHADPHQGNVLITKEGKLALIDFGIVGRLHVKQKEELTNILMSVVDSDSKKIVSSLLKIGVVKSDSINMDEFVNEVDDLCFKYKSSLKDIKPADAFREIIDVSNKFHVEPPREFLLLLKCLLTLEGVCLELDPNLNIINFAKPYAKRYFKKKFLPKNLKDDMLKELLSVREAVTVLPSKLIKTIDRIESGDFKIHFDHNIENSISTVYKTGNVIALGMIIAAYIVASTLFLANNIPPLYEGYSLIGIVGLMISFFFSILMLFHLEK